MNVKIEDSWNSLLSDEFNKPYFELLAEWVRQEYKKGRVYPPSGKIFSAMNMCRVDDVKVVILGQDPYHGEGQANGLSFSVNDGVEIPPSLRNIYKEIETDLGKTMPNSGNLERWATQGVLLLNATLTVRANCPGSHQQKGWEVFTDAIVNKLNKEKQNLVFMLWGSYAQQKGKYIDTKRHLVLKAAHPSPLSAYRGFFGCKHFSQANEYLKSHGLNEIDW